jgi:hypothetical protein
VVKGNGEFHDPQPRPEMPAGLPHTKEKVSPELLRQFYKLSFAERAHRPARVDGIEEGRGGSGCGHFIEHRESLA